MKRTLIFTLLILSAFALSACGGTATVEAAPEGSSPAIDMNTITAEGRLEPVDYTHLAFSASGVVEEVLVAEGDTIATGDMIAHLQNTEVLQADLENADAALENVEAALMNELTAAYKEYRSAQEQVDTFFVSARFNDMTPVEAAETSLAWVNEARANYEPYFGTEKPRGFVKELKETLDDQWAYYNHALEWVNRTARFEAAQVRLAQAQQNLADHQADENIVVQRSLLAAQNALESAELRTPLQGTVADLNVKAGEAVSMGSTAVTIADFSSWVIKTTDLSEVDVPNIYQGQAVIVTFDALVDVALDGTVESISSTFDNTQGDVTYEVTISLRESDPAMRWGMTALVEFVE